jgi:hypothetical protein
MDVKHQKKEYNKKYYEENKARILARNAMYRASNEETIDAQRRQYRVRSREHIAQKNREYLPIKKQKIKERRRTDEHFRLAEVIRSKVHKMLRGLPTSYRDLIGMDLEPLRDWLAFQFDPGMSWDNYGTAWHIDHVLPMSRFDLANARDRAICFGWTNLQPLWASDNRQKSNTILLHHFFNSFLSAHRFIASRRLDRSEYQRLRESVAWLRAKASGMVTSSWMTGGF